MEGWPRIPHPNSGSGKTPPRTTSTSLPATGTTVVANVEEDLGEGMYALRWAGQRIHVSSRAPLAKGQGLLLKSETSPEGKPRLVVLGPAPEQAAVTGRVIYGPNIGKKQQAEQGQPQQRAQELQQKSQELRAESGALSRPGSSGNLVDTESRAGRNAAAQTGQAGGQMAAGVARAGAAQAAEPAAGLIGLVLEPLPELEISAKSLLGEAEKEKGLLEGKGREEGKKTGEEGGDSSQTPEPPESVETAEKDRAGQRPGQQQAMQGGREQNTPAGSPAGQGGVPAQGGRQPDAPPPGQQQTAVPSGQSGGQPAQGKTPVLDAAGPIVPDIPDDGDAPRAQPRPRQPQARPSEPAAVGSSPAAARPDSSGSPSAQTSPPTPPSPSGTPPPPAAGAPEQSAALSRPPAVPPGQTGVSPAPQPVPGHPAVSSGPPAAPSGALSVPGTPVLDNAGPAVPDVPADGEAAPPQSQQRPQASEPTAVGASPDAARPVAPGSPSAQTPPPQSPPSPPAGTLSPPPAAASDQPADLSGQPAVAPGQTAVSPAPQPAPGQSVAAPGQSAAPPAVPPASGTPVLDNAGPVVPDVSADGDAAPPQSQQQPQPSEPAAVGVPPAPPRPDSSGAQTAQTPPSSPPSGTPPPPVAAVPEQPAVSPGQQAALPGQPAVSPATPPAPGQPMPLPGPPAAPPGALSTPGMPVLDAAGPVIPDVPADGNAAPPPQQQQPQSSEPAAPGASPAPERPVPAVPPSASPHGAPPQTAAPGRPALPSGQATIPPTPPPAQGQSALSSGQPAEPAAHPAQSAPHAQPPSSAATGDEPPPASAALYSRPTPQQSYALAGRRPAPAAEPAPGAPDAPSQAGAPPSRAIEPETLLKEALGQMVAAAEIPLGTPSGDAGRLGVGNKMPEAVLDKAASILLRAAGLSPDPETTAAAKALVANNAPVDRDSVQALLSAAAGVEAPEDREATLRAAARLLAKDIPLSPPLVSGLTDVLARKTGTHQLLEDAARALAPDPAVPEAETLMRGARELLDMLHVDLGRGDAGAAIERFATTFGREALGKALAMVETSAQAVLESKGELQKIDQALTAILNQLQPEMEGEAGAAERPAPPSPPPDADGEAPAPPPQKSSTAEQAVDARVQPQPAAQSQTQHRPQSEVETVAETPQTPPPPQPAEPPPAPPSPPQTPARRPINAYLNAPKALPIEEMLKNLPPMPKVVSLGTPPQAIPSAAPQHIAAGMPPAGSPPSLPLPQEAQIPLEIPLPAQPPQAQAQLPRFAPGGGTLPPALASAAAGATDPGQVFQETPPEGRAEASRPLSPAPQQGAGGSGLLNKLDSLFQIPGLNRPELELLRPGGFLDRFLSAAADRPDAAQVRADAEKLLRELLSENPRAVERAREEISRQDSAVLRETASRLSRMETDVLRADPLMNKLADAATSLRDLGRQLLAAKAENLAAQDRNPSVVLAEVPFRLNDDAGDGRMQMFYRRGKKSGDGWSSRVILDLNTTRIGPVLGDMRFFGQDMTLNMFVDRAEAAEYLSASAGELAENLSAKGFRVKMKFMVLPAPPPPPTLDGERPLIAGEEAAAPEQKAIPAASRQRGRLDIEM